MAASGSRATTSISWSPGSPRRAWTCTRIRRSGSASSMTSPADSTGSRGCAGAPNAHSAGFRSVLGHVAHRDGGFVFRGERYEVWLHRPLPAGARIGAGSFSQDTRGRWYINCPVEVCEGVCLPGSWRWTRRVGIDLGLKDLATLSTGEKVGVPKLYRKSEEGLATAQRARKTKRARAIHAKIANRRKDFLHKASAKLAKEYGFIFVGGVSPSKLAQTWMAKSVFDASWSRFKDMLAWKLRLRSGGMLLEVLEHHTTQTCSECGRLPSSRPRGIAGLGWTCEDCGTVHDRDVNAAKNILRCGLTALAEGASTSRLGSPGLQAEE